MWKMQPQSKEETHSNDFIAKCISGGYEQLYYSFRSFFGFQNPLATPTPRMECPNSKLLSCLHGINCLGRKRGYLQITFLSTSRHARFRATASTKIDAENTNELGMAFRLIALRMMDLLGTSTSVMNL